MIGHRRTLRDRADTGTVLVLALLMITTVAVVTGAVLTRGGGSLRATLAFRDVAQSSYAADAAAQIAINNLRTGYNIGTGEPSGWYYNNADAEGCFGYDGAAPNKVAKTTLQLSSDRLVQGSGGQPISAAVVCTPEDATGQQGSAVQISSQNKPGNAVLALAAAGEKGLVFKTNGSDGSFSVKGDIWSKTSIVRAQNGTLRSTGTIRANECRPEEAIAAPTVQCRYAGAPPVDPGYLSALDKTGLPKLQIPPTNCTRGENLTLQPGYYDDVAALNNLTTTNSQCNLRLAPGVYYLDFHNASDTNDPLFDNDVAPRVPAGNVWQIQSGTVVGGTLTSSDAFPGRCVSPIVDDQAKGVQIILGGDSRIAISNGAKVELCGTYDREYPPIVFYGQNSGTNPTPIVAANASALLPTGSPTFSRFNTQTAAGLGAAGDGLLSTWTSSANNTTGSVSLNGFSPSTPLPPGTVVTSAQLLVNQSTVGGGNGVKAALAFAAVASDGSTKGQAITSSLNVTKKASDAASALAATQAIPLDATFKKFVHDNGFAKGEAVFTATLDKNDVSTLDAVRLEMTYVVPRLRAQSGTVLTATSATADGVNGTGAPVISASGNNTLFYSQGTTYLPQGNIALELNNIAESVFRFGVIVRSLVVTQTASFAYQGPVIELPDNSPGFGFDNTLMRLSVYLCRGVASGCTPDAGTKVLEARVRALDPGGDTAKRQMSVLSWNHLR